MAERVKEYTDVDTGLELIEYDDGMIRRKDNGHIFKPAPGRIITAENSIALHRARKERKQNLVREVASSHVGAEKFKLQHGDMAYIAAMSEKIMEKAMRPGDPKQVEAARFLMREAGDSSEDESEGNEGALTQVREIIRDVARLVDQAAQLRAHNNGSDTP